MPACRPATGLADLPGLVERMRSSGLPVAVQFDADDRCGGGRDGGLDGARAEVDHAAYRIVQESLTNVLRHGGPAATAQVRIHRAVDALYVEVVDTGRGAATAAVPGHGIEGMREGVRALGGTLGAGPRPSGGFTVPSPPSLRDGRTTGDRRRAGLAAVRVIMLTTFDLDEYVFAALRAGASGFVLKDAEPGELLRTVRVIADGGSWLSPSVTRRVIERLAGTARDRAQLVVFAVQSRLTRRAPGNADSSLRIPEPMTPTLVPRVPQPAPHGRGDHPDQYRPEVAAKIDTDRLCQVADITTTSPAVIGKLDASIALD